MKLPRWALPIAAACGSALVLVFGSVLTGTVRGVQTFEIPQGYNGFVVVVYEQVGGTSVQQSFFTEVAHIGASGLALTSAHFRPGWGVDLFYYVDSAGKRISEIPARKVGPRLVRNGPFR